ncbi:MAG: hypothetical protein [Bacteriophage sp.]|nr:MAG: hypothetical protein [Bacteriophage sp.]
MERLVDIKEVKDFMRSLNTTDIRVKKVLSKIQLLHNKYLNELMFYLVEGVIQIDDLFNMDINNRSIQVFLESLEKSTDTLLSRKKFYNEKLRTFITYSDLIKDKNSISNLFISKTLLTNKNFQVTFLLDELGVKNNSFKSVQDVFKIYDKIFFEPDVQQDIANIYNLCNLIESNFNIQGVINFTNYLMNQISSYAFIIDNESRYYKDLSTHTFLGMILRQLYNFQRFQNINENISLTILEMATDFDNDTNKEGAFTVNRLKNLDFYSYSYFFSRENYAEEKMLLEVLQNIINLRYNFLCKIYGTTYFDVDLINRETLIYNHIITFFDKVYNLSMKIIGKLKNTLPNV